MTGGGEKVRRALEAAKRLCDNINEFGRVTDQEFHDHAETLIREALSLPEREGDARAEIMRLMREDFDPTPPNWEGREWDDNAEDVADKIIAAALSEKPAHVSDAWAIVKRWLAVYAEEEAAFSRYQDDVMLDGVMTAAEMRKLNTALAFQCCKGLAPEAECGCALPEREEWRVPEGFWLAPNEPNEAMETAHFEAHAKAETIFASVAEIWAAMKAAASSPGTGEAGHGDTDDGCLCGECGRRYRVDLNVPDDLWDSIRPYGRPNGSGLLCGSCIMLRIEALGDFGALFATPSSGPATPKDDERRGFN